MLDFLDSLAMDIYVSNCIKIFPYKSLSESLNLVLIALLREMLQSQSGQPLSCHLYCYCFSKVLGYSNQTLTEIL